MKTIAKVAIGCGVVAVMLGIVGVAALWWLKGKAETIVADEQRIEQLRRKAEGSPFTPSSDGVLREDRLLKFLEVRKRVYAVYEKHKDEIEGMGKKKQADFSDLRQALGFLGDLRLAQAQAQADLGMSPKEYEYMVVNVYKTLWAAEIGKATGGKSATEAIEQASRQAQEALKEAKEQVSEPEAKEKVAAAMEESSDAMAKALEEAGQLDVPKANLELFRKYEADIKKYAMGGLELLGL